MKNIIFLWLLMIVLFPVVSSGQEQAADEPEKPLKNSFSLSGGTSFCKDNFFNPTYDVQYSRIVWKGLFWELGYKWQRHTIEKVTYSTGEYKWNFYYAFTGYLGLGWRFDVDQRFSISPSVAMGRNLLIWDYMTSQTSAFRRSWIFSISANYALSKHWNAFCQYSYTIQGRDIYLSIFFWANEHVIYENDRFAALKAGNDFNCHDLKLGISFRF